MKLKVLEHDMLVGLNERSRSAGRKENIRPERFDVHPRQHYPINAEIEHEWNGVPDMRVCVVLNIRAGQTFWVDVTPEEFAAIPEFDVSELEWEAVMCTGNPPRTA